MFDQQYCEVDRVIHTTELFPVIHPKKANEIKGKWSESLSMILSSLLNYTKDGICYGVHFMEPVNPEKIKAEDYKMVIEAPMDLGTINNRVYLDYYKSPKDFWNDLGLVFKNCRQYFKDDSHELRIISDTLRELAIVFYKQWHDEMSKRYNQISMSFKSKMLPNSAINAMAGNSVPSNKQSFGLHSGDQNAGKSPLKSTNGSIKPNNETPNTAAPDTGNSSSHSELNKSGENHASMDLERYEDDPFGIKEVRGPRKISELLSLPSSYVPGSSSSTAMVLEPSGHLSIVCPPSIELFNPGQFSYDWLLDKDAACKIEEEIFVYLEEGSIHKISYTADIDRLYFVKWKGLSYTECSWETESDIDCPSKVNDFRVFNKALDKEGRTLMDHQVQRHRTLLEIENNPTRKIPPHIYQETRNKLYFYDQRLNRKMQQYEMSTMPIYKGNKLLRDYQIESLNWMIEAWYHTRNMILADEMGLGKTIQASAFINHLHGKEGVKGPFLVIAPLSTLSHWKKTFEEWTNLNSILYYDTGSAEGRRICRHFEWNYIDISTKGSVIPNPKLLKFHVLVTSFEVFQTDLLSVLINVPFQFIVIDEAHRLKNANTKVLHQLKRLPCKRILLLTGTPVQNNAQELWALLNYIEPNSFRYFDDFTRQFGNLENEEQLKRLQTALRPYLLRRMKDDVESSIPPLQEIIVDVEMTTIQKAYYRAIFERNKAMLVRGTKNQSFTTSLNNIEIQLRKVCNHPFLIKEFEEELTRECDDGPKRLMRLVESSGKMILLDKMLTKMKEDGKKVLIFSQFTVMLKILEEYLREKGYTYEKLDGSVRAAERHKSIEIFNNPAIKRDVFLLSTKAGGLGINLASASVVVIFDSDWNPQNDVQATARAHRIGQQSEVKVYRLITANSYEAEMFERASKKLGLDQAIFLGGTFSSTNKEGSGKPKLNKNEIETLLKRGLLGFINQEGEGKSSEHQTFEEILSNSSRLASVSLISNTYSFSKQSFVSQFSDKSISLEDPDFWARVLATRESDIAKLLREFRELRGALPPDQKKFMWRVAQCVNLLVEMKVKGEENMEEESNLRQLLIGIGAGGSKWATKWKDMVMGWEGELEKPSRRWRKIKEEDLEGLVPKEEESKKKKASKKEGLFRGEFDSDASHEEMDDGVFHGDKEETEEEYIGEEEEQNPKQSARLRIKLEGKTESERRLLGEKEEEERKEEISKCICSFCERKKCSMKCTGPCQRAFHLHCAKLVNSGSKCGEENDSEKNYELEEFKGSQSKYKENIKTWWKCHDCIIGVAECFKCKLKGLLSEKAINSKMKSKKTSEERKQFVKISNRKKNEEDLPKEEVHACLSVNCSKFFHMSCVESDPSFKLTSIRDRSSFRCPLHICKNCHSAKDPNSLWQCFRCLTAIHGKCIDRDVFRLGKKVFLCQNHKPIQRPKDTKMELEEGSDEKNEDIKTPTEKTSGSSNQRKKHSKREPATATSRKGESHEAYYSEEEEDGENGQKIPQKSKKTKKNIKDPLKTQGKAPVTYESLGIDPPDQFNYAEYTGVCEFI